MSLPPVRSLADREQLASSLAQAISRYRLRQPAVLVLEAGRPLAFLAAQLVYMAQPALSLLWPYERLTRMGQFLEDPEALQQLKAHLEADS